MVETRDRMVVIIVGYARPNFWKIKWTKSDKIFIASGMFPLTTALGFQLVFPGMFTGF